MSAKCENQLFAVKKEQISASLHLCSLFIIAFYTIPVFCGQTVNTLQPLYNTVRYNTVLDITRFKDGSQKCIDYIEK